MLFVHVKYDESQRTDRKRDVCTPRIPRVGYAAPGQWDQETSCGGDEDDRADPVDFGKLLEKGVSRCAELDEERDHD